MSSRLFTVIESVLQAWMEAARRFSPIVIAALVALAIAGGWRAATHLSVNTDSSTMIAAEVPYRAAGIEFQKSFPRFNDRIVMIVRAPTPDEADVAATLIAAQLRDRDDVIRDIFAPPADPFFARQALTYLPTEELEQLLSRLTQAAPLIKRLDADPSLDALFGALAEGAERMELTAGEQLDEVYAGVAATIEARLSGAPRPMSWQRLFADDILGAEDVHQRVLSITPVLDFTTLKPARRAVDVINEAAAAMNADGRFRVETYVTGDPVLRSEELESVSRGIALSFGVSLVFVAVLLFAALRSVPLVVAAVMAILISISITGGAISFLFDSLNLISVAAVVLLVGLGIDFAIHLALHVQEERRLGAETPDALRRTGYEIGAALALTAPTTALAFLAFVPTNFVGMAQLGQISAIGVLIAFVVTVSFMSAVFGLLGPARTRTRPRIESRPQSRLRRGVRLLAARGAVIAGAVSLGFLPFVRFDTDPMSLRDPDAPAVHAFALLSDDPDTQPYRLSVLRSTVEEAAEIAAELKALPEVSNAITLADFVPADQEEKLFLIEIAAFGLEPALGGRRAEEPAIDEGLTRLRAAFAAAADALSPDAERLAGALDAYAAAKEIDPGLSVHLTADVFAFWPYQLARLRTQIQAQPVSLDTLPVAISSRFIGDDGRARVEIQPNEDIRDLDARRRFVDAVLTVDPTAAGSARGVLQGGEVVRASVIQAVITAAI
ncbi:MAG: MMPL family transporter, partial [Caulobacterales bacterium]|nr:MMPL family transporter [Caulobacterales bacterium]